VARGSGTCDLGQMPCAVLVLPPTRGHRRIRKRWRRRHVRFRSGVARGSGTYDLGQMPCAVLVLPPPGGHRRIPSRFTRNRCLRLVRWRVSWQQCGCVVRVEFWRVPPSIRGLPPVWSLRSVTHVLSARGMDVPTGTPRQSISDGYHAKPPCLNGVCMVMTPVATCCSVGSASGSRKPSPG